MKDKTLREWSGEEDTIKTIGKILITHKPDDKVKEESGLDRYLIFGVVLTDELELSKSKSSYDGEMYSNREMWECEIIIKPINRHKPKKENDADFGLYHGRIDDVIHMDWHKDYNWDKY